MVKGNAAQPRNERDEISKYELLVKLAAGGMGTVYVARGRGALGFESLVAVKRPHIHLLEAPDFRRAVIEEARIASRIRHVNVVPVRDVDVEGALVYLVMDYVEGASLAQLVIKAAAARSPIPSSVCIRIALDACAGLHAAHEARGDDGRLLHVIHRDVTPHNILLGTDGVARLTDFGIAKCLTATGELTAKGMVKGKLGYMAPEYVGGGDVDRQTDVFGLGVVVWEMLTCQRLFHAANDAAVIHKLVSGDIPPPSDVRSDLHPALDAVVLRALSRDPQHRHRTAEAFGDALEEAARAAGLFPSHREVAAVLRTHLGSEIERRAAAVRSARVDENTMDLSPSEAFIAAEAAAPSTEPLPDGIEIRLLETVVAPPRIPGAPAMHPPPQRPTTQPVIDRVTPSAGVGSVHSQGPPAREKTLVSPRAVRTLPIGTSSSSPAAAMSEPPNRGITPPTAFGGTAEAQSLPSSPPRRRGILVPFLLLGLVAGAIAGVVRMRTSQQHAVPDARPTATAVASTTAPSPPPTTPHPLPPKESTPTNTIASSAPAPSPAPPPAAVPAPSSKIAGGVRNGPTPRRALPTDRGSPTPASSPTPPTPTATATATATANDKLQAPPNPYAN